MFNLLLLKHAFSIVAVGVFTVVLLLLNHYKNKSEELAAENKRLKEELQYTIEKYNACHKSMEEIKIDYNKRLKEYVKKLNQKSKYEKLKNVPVEGGSGDECKDIKNLLELYRDVESSGYFRNSVNRELWASSNEF
ncbi:MAG: hypothetical protein ABDI07_11800 [Candidatus Kryptonium sp.]